MEDPSKKKAKKTKLVKFLARKRIQEYLSLPVIGCDPIDESEILAISEIMMAYEFPAYSSTEPGWHWSRLKHSTEGIRGIVSSKYQKLDPTLQYVKTVIAGKDVYGKKPKVEVSQIVATPLVTPPLRVNTTRYCSQNVLDTTPYLAQQHSWIDPQCTFTQDFVKDLYLEKPTSSLLEPGAKSGSRISYNQESNSVVAKSARSVPQYIAKNLSDLGIDFSSDETLMS